jgi:hypothetical protein
MTAVGGRQLVDFVGREISRSPSVGRLEFFE